MTVRPVSDPDLERLIVALTAKMRALEYVGRPAEELVADVVATTVVDTALVLTGQARIEDYEPTAGA